ncbi:MAG: hypothetical protein E6R03_10585 [Hyphomicrobiaceae bacterium]|nr:MAG: hypothetical protein E6R03_10585 [Hyphomicrobiaceae bacterium]
MPKRQLPKRTFGNGEISPEFYLRRDAKIYEDGAKRMRNVRAIDSGSFEVRPGTYWINTITSGILVPFYFSSDQYYVLHFYDGGMTAYLPDGSPAGSLSGAPWTSSILNELRWTKEGDALFVAHRSIKTQKITRIGAVSWSLADYAFASGYGGAINQPYYKLADIDMTLTPSARTGSVTLTTSANFFVSGHVGTRIRYLEKEIEITAVTNGTTATGTIIQTLPLCQRITFSSAENFQVGHIVEQDTTGVKGKIIAKSSTTIDVVATSNVAGFTVSSSYKIISPDGSATPSGISTISPLAVSDWDEQLCSPVNGYFGAVCIHRGRFVFSDHNSLPDAILFSVVGQYFNFDLGSAEDSDAIFEFVGDGKATRILDMISAETLLIFTDGGTYYIPEKSDPPFTPTAFSVRQIDTAKSGPSRAFSFERSTFCSDATGKRLYQVFPDQNSNVGYWSSRNAALLSSHLIRNPICTTQSERFLSYPERYAFGVNEDGTMFVLHAIEDQEVLGLSLWETDGIFKSICAVGSDLFALVERVIGGATIYTFEKFSDSLTLDCVKEISDISGTADDYAGQSVFVTGSTYSYGEVEVDVDGGINLDTDFLGPFQLGLFYSPDVELLPPEVTGDGVTTKQASRIRITAAYVHTLQSGRYLVNGVPNSSYRGGDDLTHPPELRDDIRKVALLGRNREPTIRITRDDAVKLKVIGVTMEVAYNG